MSRLEFDAKGFYLDKKPFTIVSGTIHYFRVVPGLLGGSAEKAAGLRV